MALVAGIARVILTRVQPAPPVAVAPPPLQAAAPAPAVGHPAPDFTLGDLTGRPVARAELRGQVVLVNIWATLLLGLHGLSTLIVDAFRADAILLPGGVRVTQLCGLALLLLAIRRGRAHTILAPP